MAAPISSLPIEVIAHIQSFMSYRDATRSSCLCQGLYASWYRRKEIELDEDRFQTRYQFGRVARATIRRYEGANLPINKIILHLSSVTSQNHLSERVLVAAAKMGAKEINIFLTNTWLPYRIPMGIFETGTLVKLKLIGGSLGILDTIPVKCYSLKSLTLLPDYVEMIDTDILQEYILRCPHLDVLECRGFMIRYDNIDLPEDLHNIRCLIIDTVKIQDCYYINQLLLRFRCLIELKFRNLPRSTDIVISAPTVECFEIEDIVNEIDIVLTLPRIRKFKFNGLASSKFTFTCALTGVLSSINVSPIIQFSTQLVELHQLLSGFKESAINLSIRTISEGTIPNVVALGDVLPVPVQALNVMFRGPVHSVLEGLMLICHPRQIKLKFF